ncbi:MAG: hypothetical protein GY909_04120 [Oligoflexia bacterium]|nr:hypothetical protein [Oligoflexia bacterium]
MNIDQHSIAIIGLGNQAKAWAMNLRDSGRDITILLRDGSSSFDKANELGFSALPISKNLDQFSTILCLIPDDQQVPFIEENQQLLQENCRLVYAHGWSIACEDVIQKFPQFNHLLLAPKAISSEVRFQYESKGKLAAVYSIEGSCLNEESKNDNEKWIKALAKDLGITGLYPASARDETYADLFSEQSLLCGLMPYAAKQSFDLLIEKGINPEVAFFECWLEVKLIADAMVKLGPESFFQLISPNALLGAQKAQHLLFDKVYQSKLESLYKEIEDGEFTEFTKRADIEKTREEIIQFWKSSLLNKTYKKVQSQVIPS